MFLYFDSESVQYPEPGDDEDPDEEDDEKTAADAERILRDYRYKLQCQLMASDRNLKVTCSQILGKTVAIQ